MATVSVDDVLDTMRVQVTFSGRIGTTTASHIHCCVAFPTNSGVATQTPTFAGFPLGVTAGAYDHTFDMTDAASFNGAFIIAQGGTRAGAWAALLAGMAAGQSYLNIQTNQFPGGEIRGFLAVPEPGTLALLGLGPAGVDRDFDCWRSSRSTSRAGRSSWTVNHPSTQFHVPAQRREGDRQPEGDQHDHEQSKRNLFHGLQ